MMFHRRLSRVHLIIMIALALPVSGRLDADFTRGDVNNDKGVDITDALAILTCQFLGDGCPLCHDSMDTNDDGMADVTDAIHLLTFMFIGGVEIPPPNECGSDPTEDELPCDLLAPCFESAPFRDLWTSAAEIADHPTEGLAWDAVFSAARQASSDEARVYDQRSDNNVAILAAGIVYAREGDSVFKDKVVEAIEKLVSEGNPRSLFPDEDGCPPTGPGSSDVHNRTLAWGRELGAYVLAADLVGYRSPEFAAWLVNMTEVWDGCEGRTMRTAYFERPNNWGMMNFGSLVAAYAYLGDTDALVAIRDHFVRGLEGPAPTPLECTEILCFDYGRDDTWHCDPDDPRLINPPCEISCDSGTTIDIGGLIPDDQRRSGSFFSASCDLPEADSHVSDWITGAIMGARVLERVQMPIWLAGNEAFRRLIVAHTVTHPQLFADDEGFQCHDLFECKSWVLPILEEAYGLTLESNGSGASKNAGFAAFVVDPAR